MTNRRRWFLRCLWAVCMFAFGGFGYAALAAHLFGWRDVLVLVLFVGAAAGAVGAFFSYRAIRGPGRRPARRDRKIGGD